MVKGLGVRLLGAVSMTALACSTANAQGIQLDGIIVTTTKTSESAIDALSGSSVIERQQLDEQFQADSVSEFLRTLPNVSTQDKSRDTAQSINIRGLQDFGRVNVLVEGARQNFQKSDHGANGQFYLEPEMLKKVEVTRGPTATIYGSGAIGGVVAFELIDADDILRPGESMAVRSRTRYATNGNGWLESGTGAVRVGNFDVLVQANGRSNDDYEDGAGRVVPYSADDDTSYLGKARWRQNGHQVIATALQLNSSFVDTTPEIPTPTSSLYDTDVKNRQYTLGYKFARPDTPLIDFSGNIYRVETELDQLKTQGTSGVGLRRLFSIETEGVDVNNTSRFNFGQTRLALTYGGDAFEDNVTNVDPGGNGDELTPNGRRTVYGAFVQSHFTFFDTFDIIAALRYDNYELEGGTTHLDGSRVSPKITAGYEFLKGMTLFGTYAEGYRAPAITETLISGAHPPPAAFPLLPNPNLKPEVAHNVEGGVNLKYDGIFVSNDAFRAKFVAFRNQVDDYIDGVSIFDGTPPFGFRFQYQNIANALLEGLELEAMYDARTWFLGVSAARIRGTDEDTGDPLLTIPADQIVLTGGIRAYGERLIAGGRVRLVADQNRVPPATPPITPGEAFTTVDLFGQYIVNDNVTLNLNLDNLFDKAYIEYRDQSYSPGFNAKLAVTVRFGAE